MTEDEKERYVDHMSEWHHASGAANAYRKAFDMVSSTAAGMFLSGSDEEARRVRSLAEEIRLLCQQEETTVLRCIERDRGDFANLELSACAVRKR